MATTGRALLILALVMALYGVGASLYGGITGRRQWVDSGRRAVYALAAILTLAFAILEAAFLRSDFSYNLVASHSSTTTPFFYKATAMWASQEGSLLLWVWLLSMWSSLVLFLTRRRLREIAPFATAVLLGFAAFFAALTVFDANPFTTSANPPAEGVGLMPLLRYPAMMFHPPMLYSGYTLCAVPFAFAIGALVTGKLDADWIRSTRRFALAAWFCLGIGILLGARWSYSELGWGGYWAWDAVENASLMPWLTLTAFIHSVMIQEKRGMLRTWNASLVLASGCLAIMGTFLVRSGVLESIHAFGASTLGAPFVTLIGVMVAGSVGLVVWRRGLLRSEHRLDSLLSRESIFLLQNLVLVGLCAVIFWGTYFPLISEALTGTRRAFGPELFSRFTVPLALVLVLLSGFGPLIAWRRATASNLRRNLVLPAAVGIATLAVLIAIGGVAHKPKALLMFGFAGFVIACVAQELWRGTRARRITSREAWPVALVSLVRRNRRRYGGYIVHAGFAVLMIGVAASSAFQHVSDVTLKPGQSARVDGYAIRYVRPTAVATREKVSLGAILDVTKGGKHVATLHTTKGFYPSENPSDGVVGSVFAGEATSEVGRSSNLRRDIWTVADPNLTPLQSLIDKGNKLFAGLMRDVANSKNPAASAQGVSDALGATVTVLADRYVNHPWATDFRLEVNPLVSWLWIGGLIVIGGGLIALWPVPVGARGRVRAAYAARVGRDLQGAAQRVAS
jgi:cytochrome c-type biogenesis protein CcmF